MATIDEFIAEWRSDSTFIEAHTSGSTGAPKHICLAKSDMIASAHATNKFFGLSAKSLVALPLSPEYIAGKMMIVRALEGAYSLVPLAVNSEIILPEDEKVFDLIPVVPTQLPSLIAKPHYAQRIRNLLIGGASPDADSCKKLTDIGYNAYISYGMTETCSHVALARADDSERIFNAMPGISFSIDSDSRLIIYAPHFTFRRLVTNDIVDLVSPSAFRWRGRYDNVINSGGMKLHPEELEKLYLPYLNEFQYYVVGRPDEYWGQATTLVIEGDVHAEELMERLRTNLPHQLCPKQIESIPQLPRTANNKLIRK